MNNLGKMILKGARTAVVGYCAFKLIDAAVKNKKEKEPEEYVSFDELPVEEPVKDDKVKKAIMIAGGLTVVSMIKRINKLEKHAKLVDEQFTTCRDANILNLAISIFHNTNDTVENKIDCLLDLKDKVVNKESVDIIKKLIVSVK